MDEQKENPQEEQEHGNVDPVVVENLAKKLEEIEGRLKEKDSVIVRTQQENATLQKILTDRNQINQVPKVSGASEVNKEIDNLEQLLKSGDIDAEEFSSRSVKLIRKAQELGSKEVISQMQAMYRQEEEVKVAYNNIFKDPDIKDFEADLSDLAQGYLQGGVSQGMTPADAAEFAKTQIKLKVDAFKSRFSSKEEESQKKKKEKEDSGEGTKEETSGLKGEGEGSSKKETKEKPITPEESLDNFVALRGGSRQ